MIDSTTPVVVGIVRAPIQAVIHGRGLVESLI
jgi:hypothetical protein